MKPQKININLNLPRYYQELLKSKSTEEFSLISQYLRGCVSQYLRREFKDDQADDYVLKVFSTPKHQRDRTKYQIIFPRLLKEELYKIAELQQVSPTTIVQAAILHKIDLENAFNNIVSRTLNSRS